MDISGRIRSLRREMTDENIDIYIVPSDDFHQSEYVETILRRGNL